MHIYWDPQFFPKDEFAEDTYMELDSERWQTKVLELFGNGRTAYAYGETEQGTFLAEAQYPEPEEVNGIDGCEGVFLEYISEEEFYNKWNKFVSNADMSK